MGDSLRGAARRGAGRCGRLRLHRPRGADPVPGSPDSDCDDSRAVRHRVLRRYATTSVGTSASSARRNVPASAESSSERARLTSASATQIISRFSIACYFLCSSRFLATSRGAPSSSQARGVPLGLGPPALASIQYRRFGFARSGPATMFSRTPPFFSIVLIEPRLSSSHVTNTRSRPSFSWAIPRDRRRIAVAWPCRRNSGTTT